MNNLSTEDIISRIQLLLAHNLGDAGRLNHILESLNNDKELSNSDQNYLENKFEELDAIDDSDEISASPIDLTSEQSVELISKIIETGVGDTSRLRYILHSINQGKSLFSSDKNFLNYTIESYYSQLAQAKNSDTEKENFTDQLREKQSDLKNLATQYDSLKK